MSKSRIFLSALSVTSLVLSAGCGLTSMPDKIDQSNATQSKLLGGINTSNATQAQLLTGINTSNGTQAALQKGINTSNATQEQLLAGITTSNATQGQLLTGITTSNATQQQLFSGITASNATQQQLLVQLQQSNATELQLLSAQAGLQEAIRLQTVGTALSSMFADRATRLLYPVPVDMITYGQTAAQAMKESELVGIIGALLVDVTQASTSSGSVTDPAVTASTNKDKLADLWGIMILAGEAPESVVEQAVATEITQGGPNADTVPVLLAARWNFIMNVQLGTQLNMASGSSDLNTPGKIGAAVQLLQELDYIDGLKLNAPLALPTNGLLDPSQTTMPVDPTQVPNMWQEASAAFTQSLDASYKGLLTGTDANSKAFQQLEALAAQRVAQLTANPPAAPIPPPAAPTPPPAAPTPPPAAPTPPPAAPTNPTTPPKS